MLTHWNRLTALSAVAAGFRPACPLKSSQFINSRRDNVAAFSHISDTVSDYSGIIAAGVDSSSRIAIGMTDGIALTHNHGTLDFERNLIRFDDVLRLVSRHLSPDIIVSDSHPGLAASRVARSLAGRHGMRHITVDHAHAHAAAVMAENGLHGRFIAIVLGDGNISEVDDSRSLRGEELLLCSRKSSEVIARAEGIVVPRNAQPWEAAVGIILSVAGSLRYVPSSIVAAVGTEGIMAAARKCDTPSQSITVAGGRPLWDGIAAITASSAGLPEGHMADADSLERLASGMPAAPYSSDPDNLLSVESTLDHMLDDLETHTDPVVVAARFHSSRAEAWALAASRAAAANGINRVIVTGELTRNALLTSILTKRLQALGLRVYTHINLAPTDAATALGQAAVAAEVRA